MALYAMLFLLGAIAVLCVVLGGLYAAAKRASVPTDPVTPSNNSSTRHAVPTSRIWSMHVGALDEPAHPQDREEIPTWKRHAEAMQAGEPGMYKTRRSSPFRGEHWDPFAESQSTASRAKAARRKPRPHRSAPVVEPFEFRGGETDAYSLLGISRVASAQEVERAYRLRVSTIHPDKFHGDPVGQRDAVEQLKQLNLAMKVVRDRLRPSERDTGEAPP
jgi:hypothetical protein